jgi:TrpR-related protein YerC/YecD
MDDRWNNKKTDALAEAVLALRSKGEAKKFLRDLLTQDEILEFGNRWQAARMLSENISYTTIRCKTGLSPRTIARISGWLKKGMGGYRLMIKRLALHHHNSSPPGKGLR